MDQTNENKNSINDKAGAVSSEEESNIVKKSISRVTAAYSNLTASAKRIAAISLAAVVVIAIILTIVLNSSGGNYTKLYSDLSASETGNVYQALLSMGADAKIDSGGAVLVPTDEYDIWILQLAAKGYPKTALPYDVFSNHSGMTATESEKAQWLLYQLQDRIQATLERMEVVESATVTITIPETSDYVWDRATNEERASAGVLLTLNSGVVISGEQVSAIRTLIASSVPDMNPEDVTVVDATTMLELSATGQADSDENGQTLAFELTVQEQIEKNVVRLLTPRYGAGGVVAVAKVTIDYDKMMTEKYELLPTEDGDGFITSNTGDYTINGEVAAGDIVGEENNTDIPQYAYTKPSDDEGLTDYTWNDKYDYGYLKTQIESGNAILDRATVSVMVKEDGMTPNLKKELSNLVSGCTDIPTDLIFVSSFQGEDSEESTEDTEETSLLPFDLEELPLWVYLAAAGILLILLFIIILISRIRRKRKNREAVEAQNAENERKEEEARMQNEIEEYKKSLEDIAKGNINPKDEAIVNEVRGFAKSNPEITANLLRSWLKEGE